MIYVLTVHWRSERWIDIQRSYLDRNIGLPFQVYGSLEGIDLAQRAKFHYVSDFNGYHAQKLNDLARVVVAVAKPEDVLIFLDGDAFPVAPLGPWLSTMLARSPLVAVRRAENLGDPQPHPCFCVTTAGFWSDIKGDWMAGYEWRNSAGQVVTDVGGNLLRLLQAREIDWLPLLRTNTVDLHSLFFGIYGDVVYHHGAGFRAPTSRIDSSESLRSRLLSRMATRGRRRSLPRRILYRLSRRTMRRQEAANRDLDAEIYSEILRDPAFFRRFQAPSGSATTLNRGLPA